MVSAIPWVEKDVILSLFAWQENPQTVDMAFTGELDRCPVLLRLRSTGMFTMWSLFSTFDNTYIVESLGFLESSVTS